MVEWRTVSHFIAAAETGAFSAAAARLRLSQQAISQSVARLEANLGTRLFDRDGRRLRLTPAGELLLPHARAITAEAARFRAGLDDLTGGTRGTLRLGLGPSAATHGTAAAVARFLARRPGLRLVVMNGLFDDLASALVGGRLDLFIAVRQDDRPAPLLGETVLGRISYGVFAGSGHPLAHGSAPLAALAAARWIGGAQLGTVAAEAAAVFAGTCLALPPPAVETSSVAFARALLAEGGHLMILPETLVAADVAERRLVRLDGPGPWHRPLVLARRARAAPVRSLTDFAADLASAFA